MELELELELQLELILQASLFPVPLSLWTPNLAGWLFRMRGPTHKVTWNFDIVVTWQIKNAISVFSQGLCTPNLAGRWLRMRRTRLQGHVTHRLSGHVTNQKRYIFTFTRPMKPQTYQGGDLGWGGPTQKITWHFNCMVTWKIKNVIFLQPQSRRDVKGKLALAKINTKMRLHNCLCETSKLEEAATEDVQ